jgi:N-acetylmuramoyl-L-alanine amidase
LFTRDPVISFSASENLNDKLFTSSSFAESNGSATLTINGNAPLLAKFADNGKTILITPAPAPPTAAATPPPTPAAAVPPTGAAPTETTPPTVAGTPAASPIVVQPAKPASPTPTFLVVIDAAHGGSDMGARITPNLLEKDITLLLARKVRQELQTRHIATEMLRDADNDLGLDQRAVITNLARPSIFVSLHAEPASTLRIYAPALPSPPAGTIDRAGFLPWQSAQSAFSGDSASLAAAVADAMAKRKLTSHVSSAFLQPLHSIAAPAIAIEAPADKNGLRVSADLIAGAVAEAVAVRKWNAGAAQ